MRLYKQINKNCEREAAYILKLILHACTNQNEYKISNYLLNIHNEEIK